MNDLPEPRVESVQSRDEDPAHVRHIHRDDQNRRCTTFVCDCDSNERAKLIAELLGKHYGCAVCHTAPPLAFSSAHIL